MILSIAYIVLLGAFIAGVAALGERIALLLGRQTRYVWIAAICLMMASALLGVGLRTSASAPTAAAAHTATAPNLATGATTAPSFLEALLASLENATGTYAASTALNQRVARWNDAAAPWDSTVLIAWALLSAFVGGVVVHALLDGRRLLQSCEAREVGGTRVLVTDNIGPAATGVGDAVILLPRWALDLEDHLLDLVVRHEREHLSARDPLLLFVALIAIVLLPWHLPLWYAWQRLRLAIEVDCDSRLLHGRTDTRRYAQLLLLIGQRVARPSLASQPFITVAAPLQPQASHLARRIHIMTASQGRHVAGRVAVLAAAIAVTATLAFAIPLPRRAGLQLKAVANAPQEGRVIVHVTSVGLSSVPTASDGTIKGEVVVSTTGSATVGIGSGERKPAPDGIHLKTMPAMTADVTDGEVHIRLIGGEGGAIQLTATVSNESASGTPITPLAGGATTFSGKGTHLVLMKGGAGIGTPESTAPLFIVDGVMTPQVKAMAISKDSIESINVLKGEAAIAKYGDAGKSGVVLITTKRKQ